MAISITVHTVRSIWSLPVAVTVFTDMDMETARCRELLSVLENMAPEALHMIRHVRSKSYIFIPFLDTDW
jgi:hypothetical protein